MKKNNFILSAVALGMIFILEGIALIKGIDGTTLALAIGALSGLGGYSARLLMKK